MKFTGIIVLSFLLNLGPVAWTVEACLDGHSHHALFEQVSAQDDNQDGDATLPSIHCVILEQQFGAALRSAAAGIARSDHISRVDIVSPDRLDFAVLANNLWIEALFKSSFSFPPLRVLSRVYLSVFRI